MSTAKRKLVYIDGAIVHAEEGSVDFDVGGLEGDEAMAEQGFAGMHYTPKPGNVKLKVILNGQEDRTWWAPSVPREVVVEFADVTAGTQGYAFSGMLCKTTFTSSGGTADLEFGGPAGSPIQ